MVQTAFKVIVIESERNYGSRIDDYMVCLSIDDANTFITQFNAKNNQPVVPDWYMFAEINPTPIKLSENQYTKLTKDKRAWLSQLKNI